LLAFYEDRGALPDWRFAAQIKTAFLYESTSKSVYSQPAFSIARSEPLVAITSPHTALRKLGGFPRVAHPIRDQLQKLQRRRLMTPAFDIGADRTDLSEPSLSAKVSFTSLALFLPEQSQESIPAT
jgi:hypothetical protein